MKKISAGLFAGITLLAMACLVLGTQAGGLFISG